MAEAIRAAVRVARQTSLKGVATMQDRYEIPRNFSLASYLSTLEFILRAIALIVVGGLLAIAGLYATFMIVVEGLFGTDGYPFQWTQLCIAFLVLVIGIVLLGHGVTYFIAELGEPPYWSRGISFRAVVSILTVWLGLALTAASVIVGAQQNASIVEPVFDILVGGGLAIATLGVFLGRRKSTDE